MWNVCDEITWEGWLVRRRRHGVGLRMESSMKSKTKTRTAKNKKRTRTNHSFLPGRLSWSWSWPAPAPAPASCFWCCGIFAFAGRCSSFLFLARQSSVMSNTCRQHSQRPLLGMLDVEVSLGLDDIAKVNQVAHVDLAPHFLHLFPGLRDAFSPSVAMMSKFSQCPTRLVKILGTFPLPPHERVGECPGNTINTSH
ncbi:uncharacterized protein B0T23DRAFT_236060 [Neurospora hispaniola]|uniref:Uncharacterized protein n=1 Tax=Neurospora hispaniola TaxID=588809 RepID=A0AAJ0I0Y5_9PEZI|nr:hypothetical protein B0T23DRAFT_236060 [Neurospora hispaniola]